MFWIITFALLIGFSDHTWAADTTPNTFNYQGRLLDNVNAPLTGSYSFRFSLWSDSDFSAGDVDGAGAINTGATGYENWQEIHTTTTDSFGLFNIEIGSNTPLPVLNANVHTYLQIEVKPNGDPDTSYEVLDPDGVDNTHDRKKLTNNAYAHNADRLDNADIGNTDGDLAKLGPGNRWDIAYIPGATNADTFTIDFDDSAAEVELIFGQALAASIKYDSINNWFEFNADVNFAQNEIKNTVIENLGSAPGTPVAGQIYYDTTTNKPYIYDGTVWVDMADAGGGGSSVWSLNGPDAYYTTGSVGIGTNTPASALHVNSGDVNTVAILSLENTGGDIQVFRTDSNPEGVLTSSVGDIVIDETNGKAYIKYTGNGTNTGYVQFAGTQAKKVTLQAQYPNAIYEGDGTFNKGVLKDFSVDNGGTNKYNYYEWTTNQTLQQQDVDIVISYKLPDDFISFDSTPINLLYQTEDNVAGNNQIDVQLYDTTGTAVALTGGTDLANSAANFTNANITFGGGTFTAGETITLKIKLHSLKVGATEKYARVADLVLNYIGY